MDGGEMGRITGNGARNSLKINGAKNSLEISKLVVDDLWGQWFTDSVASNRATLKT
jgi:hypothetical protein